MGRMANHGRQASLVAEGKNSPSFFLSLFSNGCLLAPVLATAFNALCEYPRRSSLCGCPPAPPPPYIHPTYLSTLLRNDKGHA